MTLAKYFLNRLTVLLFLSLVTPLYAAKIACPAFPSFQPKVGPIAVLNCNFHELYEKRIDQVKDTLGSVQGRPVILNLGGDLFFKYHGKSEQIIIQPNSYHFIKSFSHLGFLIYMILSQQTEGMLNNSTFSSLQLLDSELFSAKKTLPALHLSAEALKTCEKLLNDTHQFIQVILTKQAFTHEDLVAFYAKFTPQLSKTFALASEIEIALLDKAVNRLLSKLNPTEKSQLVIVVATAHQARAKEISLQYFARKFGKRFGVGAMNENGLVVLEGKFDEDSALTLLARHLFDREAAQVIFNVPDRLQRDVLADATQTILDKKNSLGHH